jgi:glyoxylase-like metal-dependent hydrolase (beta-lactamase superfamily II)
MIFTQHYLACLSHASYLIGDETTGRAVVVDPRRDIGVYLEESEAKGLKIERVIETHLHADFLSGHLELAAATGAAISFGESARLDFPSEPLADGERISLGDVSLEIRSTPGHTPESICIAVYEHSGDQTPYGVLTGDTLFVGDVGRPDLHGEGNAAHLAAQLYDSLRNKLLPLDDAVEVYPGHFAGSACGRSMSAKPSSTVGFERRYNPALQIGSREAFVAVALRDLPPAPPDFAALRRRNAGR